MPASARSPARASSHCAAHCLMYFRWAAKSRCAWTCWMIASTRSAASIRTRSARSRASSSCACCRRASCRWMPRRCAPSGVATARASRAMSLACRSTAASARASHRPGSSSTCHCSSMPPRRSPTTCRRSWWSPATAISPTHWRAPGRASRCATRTGGTTSSARYCRRPRPSSNRTRSLMHSQSTRACASSALPGPTCRSRQPRMTFTAARRPNYASMRAPRTLWRRSPRSSAAIRDGC